MSLLHSFFSNLPQEWLEGTNLIIKHLRPVTSVAVLRIAFRIMGPLLPRVANSHSLFNKVLKGTHPIFFKDSRMLVNFDLNAENIFKSYYLLNKNLELCSCYILVIPSMLREYDILRGCGGFGIHQSWCIWDSNFDFWGSVVHF